MGVQRGACEHARVRVLVGARRNIKGSCASCVACMEAHSAVEVHHASRVLLWSPDRGHQRQSSGGLDFSLALEGIL